ncbi:YbfB/YjiJ family MFS transporter [Castellaniella sp.]|uniref:YbfB/YjiJ family MFS transporter n=1 Tax=Castellaniella sp. TaxID=1955812 RepID=UPI00356AA1DC
MGSPLFRTPLPLAGFLALAVAMGIGRFAFTPILPMMQADQGISLSEGGWLASTNYLGYLLGALFVTRLNWTPARLLQAGMWLVVLPTAAMGLDSHWLGWLAWRLLAGVASAFVLIGVATLGFAHMNAQGRPQMGGVMFSGVGIGIMFAGLTCMALTVLGASSSEAWLWLAAVALLGLMGASTMWREDLPAIGTAQAEAKHPDKATAGAPSDARPPAKPQAKLHWGLILCYGVFGFGYILPATFLPAQAKELVPDPWMFSLAWPVLGLTSAAATLLVSFFLVRRYTSIQIWAASHGIMALGLALPIFWHTLTPILIAACCIGSTFVVITMVGFQEAQAIVTHAVVKQQMAAMTASFAVGQLIGPLFFSLTHEWFGAPLEFSLAVGAVGLIAGAVPILRLH